MKNIRVSDETHQRLTALLGELTAQTMKMQTYTDAIEALLEESVILPPELLAEVESFIEENKHLGYTTREEFIRDAARWRLRYLREEYEYVEIPREEYERLNRAVKEMDMPYYNAADFIDGQIKGVLKQYAEWEEKREE